MLEDSMTSVKTLFKFLHTCWSYLSENSGSRGGDILPTSRAELWRVLRRLRAAGRAELAVLLADFRPVDVPDAGMEHDGAGVTGDGLGGDKTRGVEA